MTLINTKTRIILISAVLCLLSLNLQAGQYKFSPLLKSALLPGWGQLSLDRSYGYGMIAGEILFWSAYCYNLNEQDLKHRESYEYALQYAHVNPGNYPDQYYRDLAKFQSSGFEAGGYNSMVRTQALELFPGDPVQQQQYIDQNSIPDNMAWNWDSQQYRKNYSSIRNGILELRDRAQLITGIMIANHVLSTIDMLRLKKHWTNNIRTSFRYDNQTPTLMLQVDF